MKYTFHTCDVFTNVRFGGNPLAVVLGAGDLTDEQMQTVANEFNLSETAFVMAASDSGNAARVRIFTPKIEMPFAGHPTVGSACLIAKLSQGNRDFEIDINLEELAGLVPVKVRSSEDHYFAQLVAPGLPDVVSNDIDNSLVARALSVDTGDVGFNNHITQAVHSAGNTYLFVPVKNRSVLSKVAASFPDFTAMENTFNTLCTVVYATGGVDDATDFSIRVFAPSDGVPEDPATGSAAAIFPGQLAAFENLGEGTHSWRLEQGFDMGRPSQLFLEAELLQGDFTQIRVGGDVVFVSQGEIEI